MLEYEKELWLPTKTANIRKKTKKKKSIIDKSLLKYK